MLKPQELEMLKTIAKGIAAQFGSGCEVVLHEISDQASEHSIIAIENGHVTGRKPGDGPSQVVLEQLRKNLDTDEASDRLSYLTRTPNGKLLKSSTVLLRDETGQVLRIVERKDASEEQIKIREVNAGIYCVDNELLWKYLPEIGNENNQHEYYVTDLIEIFNRHGHKVTGVIAEDAGETQGINSRRELAMATKWLSRKTNGILMDNGVTIIDPERTLISPEVRIGQDTIIYPDVRIEGDTVIGENCTIEEGCVLVNCRIGNDVHIVSSRLINCEFSDGSKVFDRRVSELQI